jgi:hypothetical protein
VGKSEGSEAGEAAGVAGEANLVEDVEEAEGVANTEQWPELAAPIYITAKNPHARNQSPLWALHDD